MSETDPKIKGEFEANLEDGEIDTDDDDQMNLTIDISKIDQSDLQELAMVKTSLLNETEELDKSDVKNFKSSSSRHKTKRSRKPRKQSKNYSEKTAKLIDLDLYDDIDEHELLGVRGASPSLLGTSSLAKNPPKAYNISDESSYDSDYDYHLSKKRRKKARKTHKKRISDADKNLNKKVSSEQRGQHNDDDDKRSRDGKPHRKLEICKFYLSENCSKSDKCTYMHSDFPCKYYYLGMDCVYKPTCKFSHGKPLSKNFREILLKHITSAPKEILGKFDRMSFDKANELLMKQHDKLCKEFKIDEKKNSLGCSENLNRIEAEPIPSLLDMNIKAPRTSAEPVIAIDIDSNSDNNNDVGLAKSDKVDNTVSTINNTLSQGRQRRSRWTHSQNKLTDKALAVQKKITEFVQQQEAKLQPNSSVLPLSKKNSKLILNLKLLTNILSIQQIEKLESLGVKNLKHLSQLSLLQLNSIGLTATQISAVQLNTINMEKIGMLQSTTASSTIASPPKIQKDEDDSDDEETELCIDESIDVEAESEEEIISDCIKNEDNSNFNKESNTEVISPTTKLCPPIIPVFEESMKLINTKVIDISSVVSSMLQEINLENDRNIRSPTYDSPENFLKGKHSLSPEKKMSPNKRCSMYDGKPNTYYENSTKAKKKVDTDMRIIEFIDLTTGEGDVDLRIPYNPMAQTLIPEIEINGLMMNSPIKYQIDEIFIPESDYSEIRCSFRVDENTQDPRLRRIFCLKDSEPGKNKIIELLTPDSPDNKNESKSDLKAGSQIINLTSELENTSESSSAIVSLVDRSANTDLIQHLQKSQWYKDLNSKDKVMVNQQMALISSELKKFQLDVTPLKTFDNSFISQNKLLQKILIYLEIYIDADGQIKHIPNIPEANKNYSFFPEQPIKSVGLLPTPILDVGLLPPPLMEFSNNQLNHNNNNNNNYQNNFNYLQNQNFGNMNNLQSQLFAPQNNMEYNFNSHCSNNIQSHGRTVNLNQAQRYQRNLYCHQNFNANNTNNNNFNNIRRNNFNRNNPQYNNGGNKKRNKFRGYNKI